MLKVEMEGLRSWKGGGQYDWQTIYKIKGGGDPHPLGGDSDVGPLPNSDHFLGSDFLLCNLLSIGNDCSA